MSTFTITYPFTVDIGALQDFSALGVYPVSGFRNRNGIFTGETVNELTLAEQADLMVYLERFNETEQSMLLAHPLTVSKLSSITTYYITESAKFAAENSVAMTMLGYTTEQKMLFVSKAVEAFTPIKLHVELYSYYVIWDMFDAIVRDEILTEERIAAMKAGLYAKVFE